jgi:type I restriction enzyme S subunit
MNKKGPSPRAKAPERAAVKVIEASSAAEDAALELEAPDALVPKLRFPEFRDTGGWEDRHGRDLFEQINDRNPPSGLPVLAITQEHGAIPRNMIDYHVSVTDKSIESYKVVRCGDFIISLRSFQGGIEFSRYHGICSPAYVILRRRGSGSDEYFRHYLKTDRFIRILTKNLEGLRDGKMVSYAQFSELQLPVPNPAEQQRIADCLSSLDELIAAQGRKLDALKTHKSGLMQQLFPREGETVPSLRFPEFQDAGEWEVRLIGDLNPYVTSGSRGWAAFYAEKGDLFVRITNLWRDSIYLDLTDSKFVNLPAGANEGIRTQLREHDVLISITADIGIIGYVDQTVPSPAYINQHIALVRFNEKHLCGKYVAYFLASEKSQSLFRSSTDTGTKAGMSLAGIQKIELMLPRVPEQHRIANCLSSLDTLIAAEGQKLDTLKTHKKGLMQQLFPTMEDSQE